MHCLIIIYICNMKKIFVFVFSLLSMICVSCSNSKFNDAVSLLGSLPVFFDDNRLDQTVTLEDGKILMSFTYNPPASQWANNVIGNDWVIPVFLQKLFNNSLAVYTIGSTLDTAKGESPIDDFLDMAEGKNITFVIQNADDRRELTVKELRAILNDDSDKYMAAPFVAIQLDKFAKDYNSVMQSGGLYMANATMEKSLSGKGVICFNINCFGKLNLSKCNEIAVNALADYSAFPIHCVHNDLGVAFRYHMVASQDLLVTNQVFENLNSASLDDKIFYVPSDYLSKVWGEIKNKLEREAKKDS